MRTEAIALARRVADPGLRLNFLREYLQSCTLRSLHESRAFENLSFVGGTALRYLHSLPRFSEDLDLSLESPDRYEPLAWIGKIKRDLRLMGFECSVSWNDSKTVNTGWIRVPRILRECGLAGRDEQNLTIKLEIDTAPPAGARLETSLVNRHFMFALRHHDLASLLAGKINAILTRPFDKGRDWYDLSWYLSHRPPVEPNPGLLRNALAQTGTAYADDWRLSVRERMAVADFEKIRSDIAPFLERPEDLDFVNADLIGSLLQRP